MSEARRGGSKDLRPSSIGEEADWPGKRGCAATRKSEVSTIDNTADPLGVTEPHGTASAPELLTVVLVPRMAHSVGYPLRLSCRTVGLPIFCASGRTRKRDRSGGAARHALLVRFEGRPGTPGVCVAVRALASSQNGAGGSGNQEEDDRFHVESLPVPSLNRRQKERAQELSRTVNPSLGHARIIIEAHKPMLLQ